MMRFLRILIYAAGITTVTSTCTFTSLTANDTRPCKGLISCSGEITSVVEYIADWECRGAPDDYEYDRDYELMVEITNNQPKMNASRFGNFDEFIVGHITSMSLKNDTTETIDPFFASLKWAPNIDLSHNKFKKLNLCEFNVLKGMEFFNLSHNAIDTLEEIGDNSFIVSALLVLDLSHNLIKTVPKHYFKWKRALQHLNLSHNSIEYIDDLAFEGLLELETLSITNNKLSQIGYFVGRLQELRLDFNNLISLDDITISGNSSLKKLTASNNNLKTIGSILQYTPALTELDLSHNDIDTVLKSQFHTFAGNLTCLDLSYNKISEVESATFEGKNIIHFKIHNNKLDTPVRKHIEVDETDSSKSQNVSTVFQSQPPHRLNDVVTLQSISQLLDSKLEHAASSIIRNTKIAIQNETNTAINKLKDEVTEKNNNITKFNENKFAIANLEISNQILQRELKDIDQRLDFFKAPNDDYNRNTKKLFIYGSEEQHNKETENDLNYRVTNMFWDILNININKRGQQRPLIVEILSKKND